MTEGNAEADVAAAQSRPAAAIRRAAKRHVTVPTPAAIDVDGAGRRAGRVGHAPAGIMSIPVRAPLPHVAFHIEEPPGIRLLRAHWMGRATAVQGTPHHRSWVAR